MTPLAPPDLTAERGWSTDLVALQREARRAGCVLVTKEWLADSMKQGERLRDAETRLGNLAALRIVAERQTFSGWIARRWIGRVQRAVDLLAVSQSGKETSAS